jgi:hypothetical protein
MAWRTSRPTRTYLAMSGRITTACGQDVLDKIATEMCPCLSDLPKDAPVDSLNERLGLCMITTAVPYQKELKRKYGVDLASLDSEKGEKLGQLLALHLFANCPAFGELAMRLAKEDEPPPTQASLEPEKSVHGTVQETKPSQFLTVMIKTDNGPTYELILLEHVANAERIYEEPAQARGLKGVWGYSEREFLDPYTRAFKTYRVLTHISLDPGQ